MNWNEKAADHADGTKPETEWELELIGDQTWEVAVIGGAKWQRDQLRADEAVERVATHMCADTMQEQIWPLLNTYAQDEWRAEARAAINALLGDT